jgi:hypothetical protein
MGPENVLKIQAEGLGFRHLLPIFARSLSGFSGRDLNVKDYEEVMAYYNGSSESGALVSG